MLTALAHLHQGERLSVQWVLGRPLAPMAVPNHWRAMGRESWLGALLLAPFGPPPPADAELRNALRTKQGEPGWRAVGRVAVMAKTPGRERQLVRQVLGAMRSAEAPGVSFWVRRASVKPSHHAPRAALALPLRLNASELAASQPFRSGDQRVAGEHDRQPLGGTVCGHSDELDGLSGKATFPGRERPLGAVAHRFTAACAHARADRRW